MGSFMIVIVIVALLVVCVVAITVIQKKEQEKLLLRQKISQFRYRANQASNILHNFSQQPIGCEARQVLMHICLENLEGIVKLDKHDSSALAGIATLKLSMADPQTEFDNKPLVIPKDTKLLSKQISQLSTLAKFIHKQDDTSKKSYEFVPVAVKTIIALVVESKVCAFTQLGKKALGQEMYIQAQKNFFSAQESMLKINDKNERMKRLEVELRDLVDMTSAEIEKQHKALIPSDESPTSSQDNIFAPKKKW